MPRFGQNASCSSEGRASRSGSSSESPSTTGSAGEPCPLVEVVLGVEPEEPPELPVRAATTRRSLVLLPDRRSPDGAQARRRSPYSGRRDRQTPEPLGVREPGAPGGPGAAVGLAGAHVVGVAVRVDRAVDEHAARDRRRPLALGRPAVLRPAPEFPRDAGSLHRAVAGAEAPGAAGG